MMYVMKLYFLRPALAGVTLLIAASLVGCTPAAPEPELPTGPDEQTARAELRDMIDRATTTVLGVWTELEEGPIACSSDDVSDGVQWRLTREGPGVLDGQQNMAAGAATLIFARIGDYSPDQDKKLAADGTDIVTLTYIAYDFEENAGFSLDYAVGTAETTVTGTTQCIERAA